MSIDPNRDFPYNLVNKKCLNSASARVINYIVKTHLIQAAITFHGGEHSLSIFPGFLIIIHCIAYPWGAFNHIQNSNTKEHPKAEECPDDRAFSGKFDFLKNKKFGIYLQSYFLIKKNRARNSLN